MQLLAHDIARDMVDSFCPEQDGQATENYCKNCVPIGHLQGAKLKMYLAKVHTKRRKRNSTLIVKSQQLDADSMITQPENVCVSHK